MEKIFVPFIVFYSSFHNVFFSILLNLIYETYVLMCSTGIGIRFLKKKSFAINLSLVKIIVIMYIFKIIRTFQCFVMNAIDLKDFIPNVLIKIEILC